MDVKYQVDMSSGYSLKKWMTLIDVPLQFKRWSNKFPKRRYCFRRQVSSQLVELTQRKKPNNAKFLRLGNLNGNKSHSKEKGGIKRVIYKPN